MEVKYIQYVGNYGRVARRKPLLEPIKIQQKKHWLISVSTILNGKTYTITRFRTYEVMES